MKDLPIIFPISLVVIVIAIFFMGAYAISEDALSGANPVYASAHEATVTPAVSGNARDSATGNEWYQNAAIFVCPLH